MEALDGLSRPLVSSMGQHDPLDGFVTCSELEASAKELGFPMNPDLADASADFAEMVDPDGMATTDPLGLGGLLFDAVRLARTAPANRDLLAALLAAVVANLEACVRSFDLLPAHHRLAFRELGLSIGLAGVSMLAGDEWMAGSTMARTPNWRG